VERLTADAVRALMTALAAQGYDVYWAEACAPPSNAEVFARELIFVIVNSGMKNSIAERIYYDKILPAIERGDSVTTVFGHRGKATAMDNVWRDRARHFAIYNACRADEQRLAFLGGLPWIGNITKYHAARNFGVDCVKPDIHLQRIADYRGTTPHALCAALAGELGLRIGTIDGILWGASARGLINTRSLIGRRAA
jgi:hypothetical protein